MSAAGAAAKKLWLVALETWITSISPMLKKVALSCLLQF
jgi:hypothetical protein